MNESIYENNEWMKLNKKAINEWIFNDWNYMRKQKMNE